MRRSARALVPLLLALGTAAPARAPTNWRLIISSRDHAHLKEWRAAWVEAVAQARSAGFGAAIDAEGILLQPDAGLERPDLPDGQYRCRTIRLGSVPGQVGVADKRAMVVTPAATCRVANNTLRALDGAQRPGGRLFRYDDARLLFLGGLAVGDETGTTTYPHDDQRALAGLIERIGPAHWRLVLPRTAWESRIQVVDLLPAD